jgi:hypothetical protein
MNQPTAAPTQKVGTIPLSGALASIGAWVLASFYGIDMPPGTEAAFATLLTFLIAYIIPERG